jgi:hypothetical protein
MSPPPRNQAVPTLPRVGSTDGVAISGRTVEGRLVHVGQNRLSQD